MALLATEAIVLHAFDYLESSRILRVVTREAGVRSVLAKGARRSSRRFGSALDLFAQGSAQLYAKPGRDLDTLERVRRHAVARPSWRAISDDSPEHRPIAELTLRFGRDDADPALFDAVADGARLARDVGSRRDARDHAGGRVAHRRGARLRTCGRRVRRVPRRRSPRRRPSCSVIPPAGHCARDAVASLPRDACCLPPRDRRCVEFLTGVRGEQLDDASGRAHQRLLREFLTEHLTDGRPLRAMELWEETRW